MGRAGLVRPLLSPRGRSFTTVAWASHARVFPDAYWRRIVPWVYDCWAPMFGVWESFFRVHRVETAFFGARDAAAHFARTIPGLRAHWLPEACDPSLYQPDRPLAARGIHVLEVGRKHEAVHARIREALARSGRTHRFALDGTRTPIFEGIDDLYRGLGDAAIMLCFPKCVTHPAEAGGVETLTQRYLESIGSGCLTVGQCPAELRDLFGFDPVIPLNLSDPAGHLFSLLDRLPEYQDHVERCRRRLLEVGTFDVRARRLLGLLADPTEPPVPEIVVRAGAGRVADERRQPAAAG